MSPTFWPIVQSVDELIAGKTEVIASPPQITHSQFLLRLCFYFSYLVYASYRKIAVHWRTT